MKKVPGVGEVKLYDNSDGCGRDAGAGRTRFRGGDAPLVEHDLKNQDEPLPFKRPGGCDGADSAFPQSLRKQHNVMDGTAEF